MIYLKGEKMKKKDVLIKLSVLLSSLIILFLMTRCSSAYTQNSTNDNQQSYNIAELNSYGEWIYVNPYGNVWRPYAVSDWMPFDNGHWVYSNTGNWTWVSYEPFGWIVYHYGNWYDDPFYGWVWIPSDGIWSPANVMWLHYGNYVSWAPRPPRGIVYGRPWEINQAKYWHVVKFNDFTKENIRNYRVTNLIRNESGGREIINRQPARQLVERSIGRSVPGVKVQRQTVKLPQRNIERMNLPQQEKTRVDQNTIRVRKEVLVPRDKFNRQERNKKK
jgi:hypothetical protein